MAEFGNLLIGAMLLLAAWSGALSLASARHKSWRLAYASRLATYATAAVSSLAQIVLIHGFVISDFSMSYVQRYSDRALPLFYKITAIWGGQEGSLLFWAWLLSVMAALVVSGHRHQLLSLLPYSNFVLMLILVFFCILLLLVANPFDTFLSLKPIQGQGLNPLLQNAYMVTHPPALYVGYVGMAIPFAFAMSALLNGHSNDHWLIVARPWVLASWYFLTLGLVLGMLWAYEELGWGGYWGWDPVENAGLIPWFTATAFLHSIMVQRRRQMFQLWNFILCILTFILTIFGTFLTRSGFIQSVHAFAQSSIGYYFLIFMGLVIFIAFILLIKRRSLLINGIQLESMLSREWVLMISNWILLVSACLVCGLTLLPNLSQLWGNKLTISAAAFNHWMAPIGLMLLMLKGLGPIMHWRKTDPQQLRRRLFIPTACAVLLLAIGYGLFRRSSFLPWLTFALCSFVLLTIFTEMARAFRARRRQFPDTSPMNQAWETLRSHRVHYGSHLVHAGIALMFIGFGGEAYKQESEVMLSKGDRASIGRYQVRYDGIELSQDAQKEMLTATLSLYRNEQRLGVLHPARHVYFKHENQATSEVDIRRTLREDLFVVLGAYEDKTEAAAFKLIINPLVNWIWIGFVLLSLGTAMTIFPTTSRMTQPKATPLPIIHDAPQKEG